MPTTRQPAGTPVGGQFAAAARPAAPGVTLADPRKQVTDAITEATEWEQDGGIDRHAFDAALRSLPETTRDDAWKSVTYLAGQLEKAWELDDIDPGEDHVAEHAYDRAVDSASHHSSREAFDEAVGEMFRENVQNGYGDAMTALREALAAAEVGEDVTYVPVQDDLPPFVVHARTHAAAHAA